MHTLKVETMGLGLLAGCLLAGRLLDGRRGMAKGALVFLPMWLIATGANMYNGVHKAGYTVHEKFPIAVGLFFVLVACALATWQSPLIARGLGACMSSYTAQ